MLSDGTVWAWGNNSNGQLGDGTLLDRTVPVQVQGLNDGVDVAAGASHSLAMYPNGTLWGWGLNAYGQIGDGGATQYAFRPTLSLLY
ncbi:Regulator of chromosome condensation (RCC1) repeat-containing protein [Stigmatella erecta]|uniref:Regulator of chromosome condensation (RCC1) repeat-containing protein n=1 Tax=Stigmatella erecta TaxID=83460 RepID=A0A1I0LAG5_9BACT|nr:Regulator of chromosome condensation (RCC1) repeat-containing protein [Stigmatella erecta]